MADGFELTAAGKKEAFRKFATMEGYTFLGKIHGDSLVIERSDDNDQFRLMISKDGKILVRTEFCLREGMSITIEGIDVTTGVTVD